MLSILHKGERYEISIPGNYLMNTLECGIGYYIDYPFVFGVIVDDSFAIRDKEVSWGYDGSEKFSRYDNCLKVIAFTKLNYNIGIPRKRDSSACIQYLSTRRTILETNFCHIRLYSNQRFMDTKMDQYRLIPLLIQFRGESMY